VMLFGPLTLVAAAALAILAFRKRFLPVCAAAAGMALVSLSLMMVAC
jgi:hypothetical protein